MIAHIATLAFLTVFGGTAWACTDGVQPGPPTAASGAVAAPPAPAPPATQPAADGPAVMTSIWIVSFAPPSDPLALPVFNPPTTRWLSDARPGADGTVPRATETHLAGVSSLADFQIQSDGAALRFENGALKFEAPSGKATAKVVSAPRIMSLIGQEAQISVGRPIAYLERGNGDCLRLCETQGASEGLTLKLTVDHADAHACHFSNVAISVSRVAGRESLEGVPLEVGRPILDTRTTQLSLTLARDQVATLPLPPNTGEPTILVFLTAAPVERQP